MTSHEQQSFKALARCIAALRKERGSSQQAVVDERGIAQQTLAHYEVGRARPPVSLLPQFSRIFAVSVDALLGGESKRAAKRGPVPKLQRCLERASRLPKTKQRFVMQMLDVLVAQASR